MIFGIFFFAGFGSFVLTGLVRRYALIRLMDIPNERSSHNQPVPRGGGVAVVLVFLFTLPLLKIMNLISSGAFWALFGAGAIVAVIGFLDDHKHIPARWRLLIHFIGGIWTLVCLGGLHSPLVVDISRQLNYLLCLLVLLYVVWLINLYNFMDGIDGIASIEAITVCLGGVVLCWMRFDMAQQIIWPMLLLMAGISGFMVWNFPNAKIFMGDGGSGFTGMILAIFGLMMLQLDLDLFYGWMILLGTFVTDATVTLFRRVLRSEKFYEAHRNHAYQIAAHKYSSHVVVSVAFGAINLFWLLPIAAWVVSGALLGWLGLAMAYLPLVGLAVQQGAGKPCRKNVPILN